MYDTMGGGGCSVHKHVGWEKKPTSIEMRTSYKVQCYTSTAVVLSCTTLLGQPAGSREFLAEDVLNTWKCCTAVLCCCSCKVVGFSFFCFDPCRRLRLCRHAVDSVDPYRFHGRLSRLSMANSTVYSYNIVRPTQEEPGLLFRRNQHGQLPHQPS